jgi:hypothetical protein
VKREPTVDGYLGRMRRRALLVHAVRALVLCAGTATLAFSAAAWLAGPVVSRGVSMASIAVVGAIAGLVGAWSLRPAMRWRGSGAARLLTDARPDLVSAARSAVELSRSPGTAGEASELVDAHQRRVRAALVQVPVSHAVPWRGLRHGTVLAGCLAGALGAVLLAGADRAASGAYALLHPEARSEEGLVVAAVVGETRARLAFPAHVGRPPQVLRDAQRIEAPRGTTIHYFVRPRVGASEASLEVAGRHVRLTEDEHGAFRGEFVVRQGGPLRIRLRNAEGQWLEDSVIRRLHAIEDHSPSVAMIRPDSDATVQLDEMVEVVWEASDDLGLRSVELVIRTPDGRDRHRSLLREHGTTSRARAQGHTTLSAVELDARPGDVLTVWVEARDGDMVMGPNVGTSVKRTLTVASESTRRLRTLAEIGATLDAGLNALADRLERPPPPEAAEARSRFEKVLRSGQAFVDALSDLADQAAEHPGDTMGDASVYASMAKRQRRGLKLEERAHAKRVAAARRRARIDTLLVEQLEKDVLLLADTLGRARIQDAAAIARELESLRREMVSLVSELRRADSPEARRALNAAIARARARMRELMGRLAQMGEDVPSDFVNAQSLGEGKTADTLAAMQEALERGDLSEVEQQLAELEHQIHSLAEALGSADTSYAEARFGPRERAMAEALDVLAGLEAEQRDLLRRSDDLRRNAAERALKSSDALTPDSARQLAERGRGTRAALEGVPEDALGPLEQEALMRARQRLDDSADALDNRDLGEARRMARKAVRDLEDLARDLELSALMFPGRNGRMGDAARKVREGAKHARELRDEIDHALPRLQDHLQPGGRRQLQEDAARQGEAMKAADGLAERFGRGPDGQPLSPEAADRVRGVQRSMKEARDGLRGRDPVGATRAQEQAARQLGELREDLERGQRSGASGGGGGAGDADGRVDSRRRVQIPGADEHEGPTALRRRLLDAMREGAPRGYEQAVQRYYEELLR